MEYTRIRHDSGDDQQTSTNPASWDARRGWVRAIASALVPVVFTAAASAATQIAHLDAVASTLVIAAGAAVSAAIGLIVMAISRPSLGQYGLRRPRISAATWWLAPLPLTVIIGAFTQGVHVPGSQIAAFAILTAIVAVNEELWFRGIVLAALRGKGIRVAVIGASVLFGVLHLTNLAGGERPGAAILQLVFAVLFGVVAAELAVLTRSLWPAIAWHATWDFVNYLGGNSTGALALVGVGIVCALLAAYAIILWRPTMRPTAGQS